MQPLYILPFDHRSSFAKHIFGFEYPVQNKTQAKKMTAMKQVIFEGVLLAQKKLENPEVVGMLVEEEFGATILEQAKKIDIVTAVTIEKSGGSLFNFEYGKSFAKHLEKYSPTYAKVLIRYDNSDRKTNKIQNQRLKKVSDFCKKHKMEFMLEVLLTGKGSRFSQMKKMIKSFETKDIKPSLWKLEGLDKSSQWKAIRKLTKADIIILGRGKTKKDVRAWIVQAAKSGVVRGFAIGRTIFFPPLKKYQAKKISRKKAIELIAKNYTEFVNLFESNRPK